MWVRPEGAVPVINFGLFPWFWRSSVLVAIGIYAIDKKIVNHYIITQVTLAFIALVGEIAYLIL